MSKKSFSHSPLSSSILLYPPLSSFTLLYPPLPSSTLLFLSPLLPLFDHSTSIWILCGAKIRIISNGGRARREGEEGGRGGRARREGEEGGRGGRARREDQEGGREEEGRALHCWDSQFLIEYQRNYFHIFSSLSASNPLFLPPPSLPSSSSLFFSSLLSISLIMWYEGAQGMAHKDKGQGRGEMGRVEPIWFIYRYQTTHIW